MTESSPGSWRDLVSSARQKTREIAEDPRAQHVMAKAGATRRRLTQEEAWAETTAAIEELVEVVIVQQQLLDDLLQRVSDLESPTGSTSSP